MKTFPRKRAMLLFLVPLPFFIAAFWLKNFILIGLAIDLMIVFVILIDVFITPNFKRRVNISIIQPNLFKLNSYNSVKLIVENKNRLPLSFVVLFDLDFSFDREYSKSKIDIPPLASHEITLSIFAKKRGLFFSKKIFIRSKSLLGLLYFYPKINRELIISVVPKALFVNDNFKLIKKTIDLSKGNQRTRIIGDGADFEMLRDYSKGDSFNRIDWKATARKRRPITRVYQMKNSFEVAIMLDCGRIMGTEIDGKSMLDFAIDSSLVLSYASIKNNDKISFTAFATDIIKHVPRTKSLKVLKKLNIMMAEISHQPVEANYQTAFTFIREKLSKRSLIVFFTDVIDDSALNIYKKYLQLLKRKHIVLLVLLRDKNIFNLSAAPPSPTLSIYTISAAADLILRRNKAIFELRKAGILVLDMFPEEVTPHLLNKYISLKYHN